MTKINRTYFITKLTNSTRFTDGCWIWFGSRTPKGYPEMRINKTLYRVHRLSYEFWNGPPPKGFDIHHLCENKRCVNPDHLVALSHGAHLAERRLLNKSKEHRCRTCGKLIEGTNAYPWPWGKYRNNVRCRYCVEKYWKVGNDRRKLRRK